MASLVVFLCASVNQQACTHSAVQVHPFGPEECEADSRHNGDVNEIAGHIFEHALRIKPFFGPPNLLVINLSAVTEPRVGAMMVLCEDVSGEFVLHRLLQSKVSRRVVPNHRLEHGITVPDAYLVGTPATVRHVLGKKSEG